MVSRAFTVALLAASAAPAFAQTVKCGKSDIVQSKDGKIIVNSNAWNATSDGASCISVSDDVSAFNVTWSWPRDRTQTHSYPYVGFHPRSLPIPLNNVTKMGLKATWDYLGTTAEAGMIANVALDIWADANPANAQDATKALYELMVWYGDYGNPQPLGFRDGAVVTKTINNIVYNLYSGTNQRGVHTMTWIASEQVKTIDMDVLELIEPMKALINESVSIGLIQLGSEAFFSAQNVTFTMSQYSLDLQPDATSTTKPGSSSTSKPSKASSTALPGWQSLAGLMLISLIVGLLA